MMLKSLFEGEKLEDIPPNLLKQMEKQITFDPSDLALRTVLLKHYDKNMGTSKLVRRLLSLTKGEWITYGAKKFREHALWIIANAPASEIAGDPVMRFYPDSDPIGATMARKIWSKHIQDSPFDIRLVRNAWEGLSRVQMQHEFLEGVLMSAKLQQPSNLEWDFKLIYLRMFDSKSKRDQTLVEIAKWKWRTQSALERGYLELAEYAKEIQSKYESELIEMDKGIA